MTFIAVLVALVFLDRLRLERTILATSIVLGLLHLEHATRRTLESTLTLLVTATVLVGIFAHLTASQDYDEGPRRPLGCTGSRGSSLRSPQACSPHPWP